VSLRRWLDEQDGFVAVVYVSIAVCAALVLLVLLFCAVVGKP
jgi:hypothetical protein